MELGMIGLGRMGAAMAERLARGGHRVLGFDPLPSAREAAATRGVEAVDALPALTAALAAPRTLWLMVPAAAVDATIEALLPHLAPGDRVIDGGNSHYRDSQRRAQALAARGLRFVDVGTSGGVWGLREGYCLMAGGEADDIAAIRPLLQTLAPAPDRGWAHVGPIGAGHFVKMVHNGIEYGLMQAYAEGFALLQRKEALVPDLAQVAELWRHGSVVRSWLLDLTAGALEANPALDGIAPYVEDSGEGRWTLAEAIEADLSTPVIALSLLQRLRSRETDPFGEKLLAAMRAAFGGHPIRPAGGSGAR
ncbi:phosphogluconate dehydrogenase (NAD(+)-dependent, decarboxylating) [Vulcaniibacterium thermophilum]|jgi:6-phosphogluconate dehydrogenase|uniref:6-phosphogluconate dehydrogenase n=1 Tax=Vulcaniibacterium thermophilum TaxID=1169913 RepID=A0A919DF34_9GAMM|nr:decarboxylating 6-phosphogluconate dehydrogenase [Vulcaniibacterium thermophilum]GHE42212.1 6-phosphogluconate dehydrogenase [Vulcaniibacterium thermophilum]